MVALGAAALGVALAPKANASLMASIGVSGGSPSTVSSGTNTLPLTYSSGGVNVTGSYSSSTIATGPLGNNYLSTSTTTISNTSSSAETITITVGQTGYTPSIGSVTLSGSGTFLMADLTSTATFNYFADQMDAQGATSPTATPGTELGTYTVGDNGSLTYSFPSYNNTVGFSATAPFSMTEQLIVTLVAGGQLTSYAQNEISTVLAVPEPASIALLGSSLLGLGVVRLRRRG